MFGKIGSKIKKEIKMEYENCEIHKRALFNIKPKRNRTWEDFLKLEKKLKGYIKGRGFSGYIDYKLCKGGVEAEFLIDHELPGIRGLKRPLNETDLEDFANELSDIFDDYSIKFLDFTD